MHFRTKTMIFTTSWDDGYERDMRIADLLSKHRCMGTFYVCPVAQHGQRMLSNAQIRSLSSHFELGGHTMSHPRLSRIPIEQATQDILDGKSWLEGIVGMPIHAFCYPYGDYSPGVRDAVIAAGFSSARTVEGLQFSTRDAFAMPTSLHLHPFPIRKKYTKMAHLIDPFGPLRTRWNRLRELQVPVRSMRSWQSLARALFVQALRTGQPYFHLWGHAYELDQYHLWKDLDEFLAFVASHREVEHKNNSELSLSLFPQQ